MKRRFLGRLRIEFKAARLALDDSNGQWIRFGPALREARNLIVGAGFSAREVRSLDLLRPGSSPRRVLAMTRAAWMAINHALNPVEHRSQLARKDLFARACETLGFPAPRLIGLFRASKPGWSGGGSRPMSRADWCRTIVEDWPDDFVVKAVVSGRGRNVAVFARDGRDRFRTPDGEVFDATSLVCWMERSGGRHGCVIQERLHNHEEIDRLSGSRHLQTVRFYTLLDRDGVPRLLHAYFKLIAGKNFVDNFRSGDTGNLLVMPELESGTFSGGFSPDGRGRLAELARHPDTGRRIDGFVLPDWDAARALALAAAKTFQPLRLVGWDVAIGPSGPVLIEGNWNSDPPNVGGRMHQVLEDIDRWGGDALRGEAVSKGVARVRGSPCGARSSRRSWRTDR